MLPREMLSAVDPAIDPCNDFYSFACGKWDEKASIPDDKTSWLKSWDVPAQRIENEMRNAVEADSGVVGTYYRSCMNEDAINKLGNKPLQPWLKRIDEVKDMKSLTNLLVYLGNHNNGAFFGWSVTADSQHPETRAFYLSPGGMTLPDQSYYLSNDEEMKEHRATEKEVIEQLLINAGVEPEQAKMDALNCLALETRTAENVMPKEAARKAKGKRLTREQLKLLVPLFHWDDFFQGIGMADVGLEGGPQLIMRDDKYFEKLDSIFTDPNPNYSQLPLMVKSSELYRTAGLEYKPSDESSIDEKFDENDAAVLRSYLKYTIVSTFAPVLPAESFAEVLKPLFTDLYGIKNRPERWKKCYHSTTGAMSGHVSKLYVEKFFPEENKIAALNMLDKIRQSFKGDLDQVSWMDEDTRVKAEGKLEQMVFEVGYPSDWPHWCKLEGLSEDEYFNNYLKTEVCRVEKSRQKLREKVDRREWHYAGATDVNAYYSQKVNGLFIPAAVIDKPFFSAEYDDARNYGSLGAVLGHEMTHGFDDQGREYDGQGRRHEWWNKGTVDAFNERARCISKQYGSYTMNGKPVNGELTLGEDIADAGGLKMAHRAWASSGTSTRSTLEQRMFFLAYAQTWCGVERKEAENTLLFDAHAPRKWRVLGTLSDSEGFAKAYNCPAGSIMNRGVERCTLW